MHTHFFLNGEQNGNQRNDRVNTRARCERFPTRIIARLDGVHPRRLQVVDVSRSGLLVTVERGPLPSVRYAVQITLATPRDVQLTLMAVVARHTTVNGEPAMGLQLFPLDRTREALWYSIVESAAEQQSVNELVAHFSDGDPLDELDIEVEDLIDLSIALDLELNDIDDDDPLFSADAVARNQR